MFADFFGVILQFVKCTDCPWIVNGTFRPQYRQRRPKKGSSSHKLQQNLFWQYHYQKHLYHYRKKVEKNRIGRNWSKKPLNSPLSDHSSDNFSAITKPSPMTQHHSCQEKCIHLQIIEQNKLLNGQQTQYHVQFMILIESSQLDNKKLSPISSEKNQNNQFTAF